MKTPPSLPALAALLLLSLAGAARAESLQASGGDRPAPQAPYLAPVPDWGHWTVTFKYPPTPDPAGGPPKPGEPPGGFPAAVETVRAGGLGMTTASFPAAPPQTFYQQGVWIATATPQGPQVLSAGPGRLPFPGYTAGFSLLDGVAIGPKTFKDVARSGGATCFHYEDKGTDRDTEAWIAVDTMLPVTVRTADGIEADFQFEARPTQPVVVPADLLALLQKEQAAYQYTRALH